MPDAELSLLYRGELSSCNYSCGYCPFAKQGDSAASMARDRRQVQRFVQWALGSPRRLDILFTPWGEALVRKHYREALLELSHADSVVRVGIQTNLSLSPRWLREARVSRVKLWCTYHPAEVEFALFLRRIQVLLDLGVQFSVGMVAQLEHLQQIEAMRAALPPEVYLWLNAWDGRPADYYSTADVLRLSRIDPHFPFNLAPDLSLGARCRAGNTALSVNGEGQVRPCHFLSTDLGNLYDGSFESRLVVRPCSNMRCDCYIGYALREDLPWSADLLRLSLPRDIRVFATR